MSIQDSLDTIDIKKQIVQAADFCVKCGLCASQCPTYRQHQTENESPRGRIALAHGLATGELTVNDAITDSFAHCLTCRRCEKICPSDVKYGELLDNTRILLEITSTKTAVKTDSSTHQSIKITSRLKYRQWKNLNKLTQLARSVGIFKLSQRFTISRWINRQTHRNLLPNKQQSKPAIKAHRGKVALFTGCISNILDNETIQSCNQLLTLCGYEVDIPADQVCCGARANHNGFREIAHNCTNQNQQVFSQHNSPILFSATGCGVSLLNYPDESLQKRFRNITEFLLSENALANLSLESFPKRILVFTACSEKNTLKQFGLVEKLLQQIPDAEIKNIEEKSSCCGAAGDYMLKNPEQAGIYCAPLIQQIASVKPDVIVSSNYPCSLHISDALTKINLDTPVMHPIKLLLQLTK